MRTPITTHWAMRNGSAERADPSATPIRLGSNSRISSISRPGLGLTSARHRLPEGAGRSSARP
jgi:hypothetical protein